MIEATQGVAAGAARVNSSRPYAEKLQDHRWLRKRDQVRMRANYQCEDCPCTTGYLHVHHVYYIYGREPWEYPDYLLKCVCEKYHVRRGRIEQAIFCAVAQVLCGMTPDEMMEQPICYMFDVGPVAEPDFSQVDAPPQLRIAERSAA